MNKQDKPLYESKFLNIGAWMYSGVMQLIFGIPLSLLAGVYLHWSIGLLGLFSTLLISLASYIVFKK
jgi:hypothetical protein